MTESVETVVIGGGVVGLAVARELALSGREVIILEKEERVGSLMSSRNSEVIHAGIYYPPGSDKARFCVVGKKMLYAYCSANHVGHGKCGKLIVATNDDEIPALETIFRNANNNGVTDLVWLDQSTVREYEPDVACVRALLSPSTGIVDSHAFAMTLLGEAESNGAVCVTNTSVTGGSVVDPDMLIDTESNEPLTLRVREVINSAGLAAPSIARSMTGFPADRVPPLYLAKGNYFALGAKAPFRHLVYPVPGQAGLGIHATMDLAGRVRFGPNVEWVDAVNYDVSLESLPKFVEAIRRYWPALPDNALHPDYSGIRPKLQGPGMAASDFVIQGCNEHGVTGLVNLFGIESPGLTASLALAVHVRNMLDADRARRSTR